MQPRSQFHPVRQRSEDGTRTSSIEMLTMGPNSPHHNPDGNTNDKFARWQSTEQQPTFREKWSPFPWRITLIILTLPLALAPIVTLSAAAETASQFYIRNRDCYPNGLWKHSPGATWEIMDSSYFFTPNLSFGKMTFTQVKVIDIAWDLIIGRGGQLLLAWVNYRVFNEWLVYHMEHHLASYKLYASVAFETTTLGTLGVLAKEWLAFGSSKTFWRSFFRWLAMLSMLLSTLYVLSFPTLMAAMTGYIAMTEPYVQNRDLNLINFGKVDVIRYIIEDASAIGYDNPLVVGARDETLVKAVKSYIVTTAPSGPQPDDQQESTWQVNSSSVWALDGKSTSLQSPSLKIKSFPTRFQRDVDNEDVRANASWLIDGRQSEVYNWTYIVEHGSCKPSETYQWGFSYIFLFMVSIFNFIWSCIMVGMWYDTRRGSRMYKSGRRPGLLRSVMEYAAAIREEIGEGGEALEEAEIRQRLTKSGGALTVPKHELKVRRTDTGEERVRKRTWKSSITKGSTF